MEFRLGLVLLFAWILSGHCKPFDNSSTATTVNTNVTPTPTRTTVPTQPATQRTSLKLETSTRMPPTERRKTNLNDTSLLREKDGGGWFAENVPMSTFVGAVSVLVLVVVVLFVVVIINRVKMRQMKELNSITSEAKQQEVPQKDLDNNEIPSPEPSESEEPEKGPEKGPGPEPGPETVQNRNESLKYDQPYAHQKQFTDLMKNLQRTEFESESLNDMLLRKSGTHSAMSKSAPDEKTYLATKRSSSAPIGALATTEYVSMDHRANTGNSEYQVPRNAKKRAGLLQRDPSVEKRQTTLKDDNDYLVLMSGKSLTGDKKHKKTKLGSRKRSSKKSTKGIPMNTAKSRIKFFQEKMTSSDKAIQQSEEATENSHDAAPN